MRNSSRLWAEQAIWCARRAHIAEPVIPEQEHDDVATDRQRRVGSDREVGLAERLSLPKISSEPEFEPPHELILNWGEK